MSTVPIRCPECGALLRVSVQPCYIGVKQDHIQVVFDHQKVAHTCKKKGE